MGIHGLLVFRKGLQAASQIEFREEASLMDQCVIVSGDDALATTIVDELKRAGSRVTRLLDSDLAGARGHRPRALRSAEARA